MKIVGEVRLLTRNYSFGAKCYLSYMMEKQRKNFMKKSGVIFVFTPIS